MNQHYRELSQTHKQQYCAAMSAVRDVFGIDPRLLQRKTRKVYIMWPRQICMCIFIEAFGWIQEDSSNVFDGMHHTTAIHARKAVYDRMQTNEKDKSDVERMLSTTILYVMRLKNSTVIQSRASGLPYAVLDSERC